jgi:hypothetical protein
MTQYTGFKSDRSGLYIEKDPGAKLDYSISYADWLSAGTTIVGSTWSIAVDSDDAAPLTRNTDVFTTTTATITVSGGTLNTVYRCFNTVTLSNGLIERRSFRILVTQREV